MTSLRMSFQLKPINESSYNINKRNGFIRFSRLFHAATLLRKSKEPLKQNYNYTLNCNYTYHQSTMKFLVKL